MANIISIIYTDPNFKKMFLDSDFTKFNLEKFGLIEYGLMDRNWVSPFNNMSESWIESIDTIKKFFTTLDELLPNYPKVDQEEIFTAYVFEEIDYINNNVGGIEVFEYISEALGFREVRHQEKARRNKLDYPGKELNSSIVKKFYHPNVKSFLDPSYNPNQYNYSTHKLFEELVVEYRTHFQVEKIISVVEKHLKSEALSQDCIFVVRVGEGHKKILIDQLSKHFQKGVFKEIELQVSDLDIVEETIQSYFNND
jgi:hypothetical protein